eukprot:gene34042-56748_t
MEAIYEFDVVDMPVTVAVDAAWAHWSRPWTTMAWCFLTVGIALGSFWAYYELGWGGWWFWDPVENASFMPWLVGTALIHSLSVTEKRGGFKLWTALLAILAFSLSLLGTFIVRSGVLSSVHAFATDPARGLFILVFFTIYCASGIVAGARLFESTFGMSYETALWAGAALEERLMGVASMHTSLRVFMARMGRSVLVVVAVLLSLALVGIALTGLSVFGR